MSDPPLPPAPILPPPSAAILLYAADGLSVWKKQFSPRGYPSPPERTIWVPMFRELVNSDEGMRTLQALTRTGMQAWRCSPDSMNSLKSAFRDITLRALIIATLEDFAEAGAVKIILPVPAPPQPRVTAPAPRPESPSSPKIFTLLAPPRRPRKRPKSPTPGLG